MTDNINDASSDKNTGELPALNAATAANVWGDSFDYTDDFGMTIKREGSSKSTPHQINVKKPTLINPCWHFITKLLLKHAARTLSNHVRSQDNSCSHSNLLCPHHRSNPVLEGIK